jgi:hypothetical protein
MFPKDVVDQFKSDLTRAIDGLHDEDGVYMSPFDNPSVRNSVSRYSFVIAKSLGIKDNKDNIVKIEIPHFEFCEKIPLRRTPLVCSHNRSINFKRIDGSFGQNDGVFDLYRLRMNIRFQRPTGTYEVIKSNFIDISILDRQDRELHNFWSSGNVTKVFEPSIQKEVFIPDIDTMIKDLWKMLYVYKSTDSKRSTREEKLQKLMEMKNSVNT